MRFVPLLIALTFPSWTNAQSVTEGIDATLGALPPLPLLTSQDCLGGIMVTNTPAQRAEAAAGVTGAPYYDVYDHDDAQRTADIINTAVATNADTLAFGEELPTADAEAFLALKAFFEASGFNADHIVDVTAFYLTAIVIAQEADWALLDNRTAISALRDQLSLGEANCQQIAQALETNPYLAAELIAHIGLLFEALESAQRVGDIPALQATVSSLFEAQLAGRRLTLTNGLQ